MNEISAIQEALKSVSPYVNEQYQNRDNLIVSTKTNPTDFLTEVDINVQKEIVMLIKSYFPNDTIIAEESGLDLFNGIIPNRCWMVDPIDGTQNFLRGRFPEFGISIGFLINGNSVAGGVLLPITQDLFLAEQGSGAFLNDKKIQVSSTAMLEEARIDIDFGAKSTRNNYIRHVERLLSYTGQIRSYGCSIMGFCQVAEGQQDVYIPFNVKPWDVAAGILLVQEAGGKVSSFNNEPTTPFQSDRIGIVSNTSIHQSCVQLLRDL